MYRIYSPLPVERARRARAIAVRCHEPNIPPLVAYLLASAIIILWTAYFSIAAGSVLPKVNIVPQHAISVAAVDQTNKGGRLGLLFIDRWNAAIKMIGISPEAQKIEQAPDGCQSSFKQIVKIARLSDRCLGTDMKLAAVE